MAVCLIRGLGFGITVVAGGALTASIIPAERRGEGLALIGLVAGVPAVVALPLGIWLAGRVGYPAVFTAGAVAALGALAAVPGLPDRDPDQEAAPGRSPERAVDGVVAGLRTTVLARPALVFSATTIAGGIIVTFLPLAVMRGSGGLAALALLALQVTATVARCLAGRYGDRHGQGGLLLAGVLAAAAGTLALVFASAPAAAIGGAVLFGAGFGVTQNATLAQMYARVPASGYGTVSALWNLAYDAGWGLGAAGFGVIAVHTGYPAGFAVTAVLILTAIAPARRDKASARSTRSPGGS
jgi:predicted MFS family arabinose efflux permease